MWAPILFMTLIPGDLPAAGGSAIEVALEYVRGPDEEDSDSPFLHRGELILENLDTPPPGDWKLPELVSKRPLYALTSLGDDQVLLVLDRADAADPFYSRIYLDANANGDLTDDPLPVEAVQDWAVPGYFQAVPLDLTLKVDGKEVPYCLQLVAICETVMLGEELEDDFDLEEISFNLYAHCCYTGEFKHGGMSYRVQLGDDNVNGRFDETVAYLKDGVVAKNRAIETTGDLLFLSDEGEPGELDLGCLGSHLVLGDAVFEIAVDAQATKFELNPLSGAQGTVKLPVDPKRLFLTDEKNGTYLLLHQPSEEVKVPAGDYRVAGYQLYREDPQGDLWFLSAVATPSSPTVSVAAGKTGELTFGEPFLPGAGISAETVEAFKQRKLERVEVEFAILGNGQEVVNDLRHVSGNKTTIPLDAKGAAPVEPRYKIVKVGGEVVSAGSFEYG